MGWLIELTEAETPGWEGLSVHEKATALVGQAGSFLCGGGHLCPTDWVALNPAERTSLVEAGKRLAIERALWAGRTARTEQGEWLTIAELDGGEMHDREFLRTAFASMMEGANAGRI